MVSLVDVDIKMLRFPPVYSSGEICQISSLVSAIMLERLVCGINFGVYLGIVVGFLSFLSFFPQDIW